MNVMHGKVKIYTWRRVFYLRMKGESVILERSGEEGNVRSTGGGR